MYSVHRSIHNGGNEAPKPKRDVDFVLYSQGMVGVEPTTRISNEAFLGVIIATLVLGLVSSILRTYWRFRLYKKLSASDWLLILSCIFLVIANVLNCVASSTPAEELTWASVFLTKASFLAFFRQLVSRIRKMEIYWWVVAGFVVSSGLVIMIITVQLETHQSEYFIILSILDVVSDAMLVSVPIWLLWNLQKRLIQKLIAGALLSVSTVLIVIATLRAALARPPGKPEELDLTWLIFWTTIEGNVAVLLLSLTAVKTVFRKDRGDSSNSPTVEAPRGNSGGQRSRLPSVVQSTVYLDQRERDLLHSPRQ